MNHLNVIEAPAVLNDEHHDEIKGKDVVPLKKKKKKRWNVCSETSSQDMNIQNQFAVKISRVVDLG